MIRAKPSWFQAGKHTIMYTNASNPVRMPKKARPTHACWQEVHKFGFECTKWRFDYPLQLYAAYAKQQSI